MNRFKKLIQTPLLTVYIVCTILVCFSLYAAQSHFNYSSDDVSWQTILLTWKPFSKQVAYVGANDNFLANVPIIWVIDHIMPAGRRELFIEALSLSVLNFTLFYFSVQYFLKKSSIERNYKHLFPFIWLACLGSGFSYFFLNTNWRDFEIGLSFFYYVIAFKYLYGEYEPLKNLLSKFETMSLLLLAVFFTYSDPYFFIFTILPICLLYILAFALKRVSKKQLTDIVLFTLISLSGARLMTSIMARVGIIAPKGTLRITDIEHYNLALINTYRSILMIFNVNFGHSFLFSFAMLLTLSILMIFSVKVLLSRKTSQYNAIYRFIALLGLAVIVGYFAIDNAGINDTRYLILMVYTTVIMSVFCLNSSFRFASYLVVGLLILTSILSIQSSYTFVSTSATAGNQTNYQIIDEIENMGLTKGYANYWGADINTYLSGGKVSFLPITCHKGKTETLPLLVNKSLFQKPATESFYLYNPLNPAPKSCSYEQVITQFGYPVRIKKIDGDSILIYNYDLHTKMLG